MLPNAGNILDQLLGGFDTAQMPTIGQSSQAGPEGSGLPFDNLLSMLINGQDVKIVPSGQAFQVDQAEHQQPKAPTAQAPLEQFLMDTAPADIPGDRIDTDPRIGLNALIADDEAGWIESPVRSQSDLPQLTLRHKPEAITSDAFIANKNLRELVGSQPVKLENAIYKVVDARINGDSLEMTVVSDDNNPQPVKLTVPAELLTNKQAGDALAAVRAGDGRTSLISGVDRVALAQNGVSNSEKLDQLLANLNLKAVEVKLEPVTSAASTQKHQVTLQMFGVVDGNQIVIKSKLDRQKIDIRTNERNPASSSPRVSALPTVADGQKPTGAENAKLDARSTERMVAFSIQEASRRMPFDLIDKLTADKTTTQFETTGLQTDNAAAKADIALRFDNGNTNTPTARLSLPPSFERMTRPTGQSVMLKIEPEQLGPARLHLSMDHNVLTARVTVESAVARMAVEHSLDQLTEQLSRAGIQVDRIQVALSDQESPEQFFHRRPNWAQPGNNRSNNPEDPFELEQVAPSPTLYSPPEEFVRADGVNLLV